MLVFCGYEDIKNLTLKHKKDKYIFATPVRSPCTRRPHRKPYQAIIIYDTDR